MSHLQSLAQESQQNDDQTFKVIEQITSTIEDLNKQILQVSEKYDIMEKDRKEQDKIDQIKKESYNIGYKDAESMYASEMSPVGAEPSFSGTEGGKLPDELLNGIAAMTDDELELLMSQNPEITEMIR